MEQTQVVVKSAEELTARDVYEVWRIRDVVFAVEQQCDIPDVDGVDLEPGCSHVWLADEQGLLASYLRTFTDADGLRHVGRVCTRRDQRGRGHSGRLLDTVHERWGSAEIALGAQAYLEGWYATFGYARSGENYWEAGIEHVPMTRPGTGATGD